MSISPIMSVGLETYVYKQVDQTAELLKKQLETLGYSSTGDVERDRLLLAAAGLNNVQKNQSGLGAESTKALPWQEILDKLGLTTTGDKTDDYNLIISTIAEKLAYVTGEDEKNFYLDLVQRTESAFALQSFDSESVSAYSNMTGASYLSSLNMHFMLG